MGALGLLLCVAAACDQAVPFEDLGEEEWGDPAGAPASGEVAPSDETALVRPPVVGSCAVGSSIRAIADDGTVTCAAAAEGPIVTALLKTTTLTNSCVSLASFGTGFSKIADIGTFSKMSSTSRIEINYNGRLAVLGGVTGTGARFELRVDNSPASSGFARVAFKASEVGTDGILGSMMGVFNGLAAGTHTVSIWIQGANGGGTSAFLDPGCWSSSHAVVNEF